MSKAWSDRFVLRLGNSSLTGATQIRRIFVQKIPSAPCRGISRRYSLRVPAYPLSAIALNEERRACMNDEVLGIRSDLSRTPLSPSQVG